MVRPCLSGTCQGLGASMASSLLLGVVGEAAGEGSGFCAHSAFSSWLSEPGLVISL